MRRSKAERMPPELREEMERIWRAGNFTLDELMEHLQGLAAKKNVELDVSRSGVHRYLQGFEKKLERYREAQQVAGMWVAKLGEEPQGDVGRLLAEMLKTVAFQVLADMGDEGAEQPNEMGVMLLAKAIKDLASADKISADREIKVREKLRADLEKKVAEESKKAPDQAEAFERARELVRGLL